MRCLQNPFCNRQKIFFSIFWRSETFPRIETRGVRTTNYKYRRRYAQKYLNTSNTSPSLHHLFDNTDLMKGSASHLSNRDRAAGEIESPRQFLGSKVNGDADRLGAERLAVLRLIAGFHEESEILVRRRQGLRQEHLAGLCIYGEGESAGSDGCSMMRQRR